MQELSLDELNAVAGGDTATTVTYGGGLATSVVIGSTLGPVGAVVAAAVYTAAFGITTILLRPPQPRSNDGVAN